MKKVLVTGTLAYDYIMDFKGRFKDHILPDKIHILNISFVTDKLTREFGGTAGNVAYNLALLGVKPYIFSVGGKDFIDYEKWLLKNKIDQTGIKKNKEKLTASAHILTDQDDNQITSFNWGPLKEKVNLGNFLKNKKIDLAIVAPEDKDKMIYNIKMLKKHKIPYVFDPGQDTPYFSKSEFILAMKNSFAIIANDYEWQLMIKKTGLNLKQITQMTRYAIVTLGPKGSKVLYEGKIYSIPPARPQNCSDPTGAGDAYRAGIIKGILEGFSPEIIGRLGSLISVYTVERYGTQTHKFTKKDFIKRFKINFKKHEMRY